MAQAVVRYLQAQYSERDGSVRRFIPLIAAIFGHGNVSGLGQALQEPWCAMQFMQGHNEQSMVHAAAAFARETRRTATFAVTASIGPGSTNMVTGAALATINRIPVLLLPSDTYATRHQGPVLQQLESPVGGDLSVNDCFRPISRFFDRIQRPEQLLTAMPEALRVMTDPAETGAVVIALPQDVQSEAFEYPIRFFDQRVWSINRPVPDPRQVAACLELLKSSSRPLIIAGGGIWYSDASSELEALSDAAGIPVAETFAGKGSIQKDSWRALGGLGVEGTSPANAVAASADLVICVGTRMADFITASQSVFKNPAVRFVAINVDSRDAHKQGALAVLGDAKVTLNLLHNTISRNPLRRDAAYMKEIESKKSEWRSVLQRSLPDQEPLTGGSVIRTINESARAGDVIITAAGAPPGELHKLWEPFGDRRCHIEFGYSCMGYELPAGLGARIARREGEVIVLVGDGSYLINPGELVTLNQELARVTVVILENQGYQVIKRLQLKKTGESFGNEFRERAGPLQIDQASNAELTEGDYVRLDLARSAEGLGAKSFRARNVTELTSALSQARRAHGVVVIVASIEKQRWLPDGGAWWDVAPAEVSANKPTIERREEYVREREREQQYYGPTSLQEAEVSTHGLTEPRN